MPVWEDFVRANDLARLLSKSGDFESAQRVVEWLIREADRGGWEYYMLPLTELQQELREGKRYRFKIYTSKKPDFPERYRYSRRLPSFKGPNPEEQRGVIPLNQRGVEPRWMSLEEAHERRRKGN